MTTKPTEEAKTDFEAYLYKELKAIYKKYVKIYGKDKAYMSMFFSLTEDGDEINFSANNNHWELKDGYKLDRFWRDKNE